jgi:uncharacterized protein (DUF4415 family)
MKRSTTSKPFFSPEQEAAALAAARETAVEDTDNPSTDVGYWSAATQTHGGGIDATLAELRRARGQRGRQKAPRKIATAIRLSPEVAAFFKAGGRGWETRIDEALREYVKEHTTK